MSELYSFHKKNPLTISSITTLRRDFDGSAKYILSLNMELERMGNYILNAYTTSIIDRGSIQPLTESLDNISKFIREHVRKNTGHYKMLDSLNIGCLVCKKQTMDLMIVFANRKSFELGILDQQCIGKSLTTVILPDQNGHCWKAIKLFAQNMLPCLECIVTCGNQSFKMLGHWLKNEIVFQLYNK